MKPRSVKLILSRCAAAMSIYLCAACSTTKHVPQGSLLLDNVDIEITGDKTVKSEELYNFLRQTPNHKVLGFAKLQLSTYSLSGSDTTRWYNRWLRSLGQPPVIYDRELTDISSRQLRQALVNRGYMDATVQADTTARYNKKKVDVTYHISTGMPRTVSTISYNIADSAMRRIIIADSARLALKPGMALDRNVLDQVRGDISSRLRNAGYYLFTRENITFFADTVRGSKEVALTVNVARSRAMKAYMAVADTLRHMQAKHGVYRLRNVTFDTRQDVGQVSDTVEHNGLRIVYGPDRYLKPSILEEKCYLQPGAPYSAAAVDRTYEALGQLGILKYINIEMTPVAAIDSTLWLDATVMLSRNKKQGVSVELEGTNSEGDLGFGVGLTYQHRNLAHGSELLTAKFRTAYESLSGDLDGFINSLYSEYAGEIGITFPKFECPFLSRSFKQRSRASTEFAISFVYQERPEYTRIIAGAAWRWKWHHRKNDVQRYHTFDLIDVNYVRLPHSTINFMDEIAPSNPLLRYSYEDHLIMRLGYTFRRTNRRIPTATINAFAIQPYVSTMRASAEVAGNVLYAISSLSGATRHDGAYKVFGTQYAQYFKAEYDYTYTRNFNSRNALAIHGGVGFAIPYGNSSMVPFEKRFYAGGANGVRGWAVRTLGPGCYDARNSVSDFINQCGDIRLDMSIEYRAKLFWVFEGALFIDAGNIWTIRDYENQPGGVFKFDKFYKQIAASYGIGLRMDFTYFLLRLDLGLKAHNPAINQEEWPLIHPRWGRDANFHFSVGYPF